MVGLVNKFAATIEEKKGSLSEDEVCRPEMDSSLFVAWTAKSSLDTFDAIPCGEQWSTWRLAECLGTEVESTQYSSEQ